MITLTETQQALLDDLAAGETDSIVVNVETFNQLMSRGLVRGIGAREEQNYQLTAYGLTRTTAHQMTRRRY